MNRVATRSLDVDDSKAHSERIAKKCKPVEESIKDLFEDFETVMDDYEEEDYEGEDYEEEDYEETEYGVESHSSELGCSSEDDAVSCGHCNGDYEDMYDDDEGEYEDADPDDDHDSDFEDGDKDKDGNKEEVEKSEGGTKEKQLEDVIGGDHQNPKTAEIVPEPVWHPLFKPDLPKVILISNDNQRFCFDRATLSLHRQVITMNVTMSSQLTFSEFFKDMFSLSTTEPNFDQSQPIFIDEKAETLAIMLSDIQNHDLHSRQSAHQKYDLATNYSVVRANDKYQVSNALREASCRLQDSLKVDPFAAFAFASRQDDVELGRDAIGFMDLEHHLAGSYPGELNLWKKLSETKPSWQVALAQLILPVITIEPGRHDKAQTMLDATVHDDLYNSADLFEPKLVYTQHKPRYN
jgi:hypothetical protein